MIKRRIDDDFKHVWAINWNGLPEDFSDATEIVLTASVYGKKTILERGIDYVIEGNLIIVDFTPRFATIAGIYNLELKYIKPSDGFIDGERRSAVDIDVVQIVAKSSQVTDTGDITSTSEAAFGFQGLSAYEVWLKDNPDKTKEDYYAWLQKPATDIAETVGLQEQARVEAENTRKNNEKQRVEAELLRQSSIQEAISNAEEATLNANTAAQNADDARLAIQDDLALKANHGYPSNPKTLKEVDDDLVQLAGDVNVLQTDVENIKNIEWLVSYGVEWTDNVASSALARVGNPILHKTLPVQSGMRGCVLKDDGAVNYYLDSNDWSKQENGLASKRDGSDGQVMIEIPEYYEKYYKVGSVNTKLISTLPLGGFTKVPKMYVSAYQATVQRSSNKLASVINLSTDYRGGNNSASLDGLVTSQLGLPATVISLTNFRTYARSRGAKWNCYTYPAYKSIAWLYYIEYANLNIQLPYNPVLTADGYKQGGLGAGVTNLRSWAWNTFNGYYPFIPCGYSDSLGNNSGIAPFNMPPEYGTLTTDVPRYRGVENPFGHIWHWVDGIKLEVQSDADGAESRLYTSDNPINYNSSGYELYKFIGLTPRTEGYVKSIINDQIMPATVGAGSTTYFSDYHYRSTPASGVSERAVLFGGSAHSGADAGLACSNSHTSASYTYTNFGSRLCFHE